MKDALELIIECSKSPSFTTFEDRIHPLIEEIVSGEDGASIEKVPDNNLIIAVPGNRDAPPVAITAHLDKINHFGEDFGAELPVKQKDGQIIGQLDDSVGVGIILSLMLKGKDHKFPPLMLLLSEMEESTGFRNHPHLLRDFGIGLHSKMGAERIANHLTKSERLPSLVITIDTTPFFNGKKGIALYSSHWELHKKEPSAELISSTRRIEEHFQIMNPGMRILNNSNDYVTYGEIFNKNGGKPIPSVAVEPGIFPYHQKEERVFVEDIERVWLMLQAFLESYNPEGFISSRS